MATFGDRLSKFSGIGPGFDYLRLGLALVIFNAHAGAIFRASSAGQIIVAAKANGAKVVEWSNWREPVYVCLVPMFFALSGFLVTGSAFRTRSIQTFLAFRVLRIVPALAVEVSLSAILLGAMFTTLDLSTYYTSAGFVRYFGNIAGFVEFYLPGVFQNSNVRGVVNNSLWTLPAEFFCYAIMIGLMASRIAYNRRIFSFLFIAFTVGMLASIYVLDQSPKHGNQPVWLIVYYFFAGVFFFHWRDRIPFSTLGTVAAGLIAFALIYVKAPLVFVPFFLTYFTIGLGVCSFPALPILARNDFSYGIYLYGFPISQAVNQVIGRSGLSQPVLRGVALLITVAFAVISWNFLERHALAQKKRFVKKRPAEAQVVEKASST